MSEDVDSVTCRYYNFHRAIPSRGDRVLSFSEKDKGPSLWPITIPSSTNSSSTDRFTTPISPHLLIASSGLDLTESELGQ
jgi:hypothetical protein